MSAYCCPCFHNLLDSVFDKDISKNKKLRNKILHNLQLNIQKFNIEYSKIPKNNNHSQLKLFIISKTSLQVTPIWEESF